MSLIFGRWPFWLGSALAVLYCTASLLVLFLISSRGLVIAALSSLFLLPVLIYIFTPPSHARQWQDDVRFLPYAAVSQDHVTIHNIRNNRYSSESNYDVHYFSRTYDLNSLVSMDVFLVDWGLRHVVHTMVSFGFAGGDYLCLSIEARKEVGESYSAIKGFFRQYEQIYILGLEDDLVRLRSNHRTGEDVYLYRLRISTQQRLQQTFLGFMDRINELKAHPRWYNALYNNCMTSAFRIARSYAAEGHGNWHWSVILNGHAARRAYDLGLLDTTLSFEELQRRSYINDKARKIDMSGNFSVLLRENLPGMNGTLGSQ